MMNAFSWRKTEKEKRVSVASIRAPATMARTPAEPIVKAILKVRALAPGLVDARTTPMRVMRVVATKAATAV